MRTETSEPKKENVTEESRPLNEQEFLELIEKYRQEFYRYVHRKVWNASEAEDVFSESVMTAWRQRDRFRRGTNFRAWMYKILTNKIYVANRHTQRTSIDMESLNPEQFSVESVDPSELLEDRKWFLQQVNDDLFGAIGQLREPERDCLMLRALENCTYKEIATILSIPVGTVMTHLARGRAKARDFLEASIPA